MGFKKEYDSFDRNYTTPRTFRLSEVELVAMNEELEKYRYEKEVELPEKMKISLIDEKRWLYDKGAITKDGSIILNNFKSAIYDSGGHLKNPADCEPILFEQLNTDLEQWKSWKSKKSFIESKKIEGLERLAKGMHVDIHQSDVDF